MVTRKDVDAEQAEAAFCLASIEEHRIEGSPVSRPVKGPTIHQMSLVDLGKRLLESAKQGATNEVRTLMSNGAPFTTDWLGTSPLHFASQYGHVETAEVLLRAGISRDARTKVDRTPLHVAAQEGHIDIVELLLQNGADIEAKDMLKMTPLHWAVEKGHLGVIELLLVHSADINCENKFERTAVEIAMNNARNDIVEILHLSGQNIVEVTTSEQAVVEEMPIGETVVVGDNHDGQVTFVNVKTEDGGHRAVPVTAGNLRVMDGSVEQSSTAVLATLAALAEATAPNNNTSTATTDALSWLEQQGITMIAADDNSTIVNSGLQAGQTLTLTEAGKLALNNYVEKDGVDDGQAMMRMDGDHVIEEVATETGEGVQQNHLITIMTENGELQTVDTSQLVAAGHQGVPVVMSVAEQDNGEPAYKRIKLEVVNDDDDNSHHLVINTGTEVAQLTQESVDELSRQQHQVVTLTANGEVVKEGLAELQQLGAGDGEILEESAVELHHDLGQGEGEHMVHVNMGQVEEQEVDIMQGDDQEVEVNEVESQDEGQDVDVSQEEENVDIGQDVGHELNIDEGEDGIVDVGEAEDQDVDIGQDEEQDVDIGQVSEQDVDIDQVEEQDVDVDQVEEQDVDVGQVDEQDVDIGQVEEQDVDVGEECIEEGVEERSDLVVLTEEMLAQGEEVLVEHLEVEDDEQDELRRQLEAVQREAEQYKEQLKQKQEQAEKFKKQLTLKKKTS